MGLQPGDRVLIGCDLRPACSLAYLGAMYVGCVPVLLDERTLSASGESVFTRAQCEGGLDCSGSSLGLAQKKWLFHKSEGNFDPRPVNLVDSAPVAKMSGGSHADLRLYRAPATGDG